MSRADIVSVAVSELGPFSQARVDAYWKDVLKTEGYQAGLKQAWCGAFALFCLHKAGYALDKH